MPLPYEKLQQNDAIICRHNLHSIVNPILIFQTFNVKTLQIIIRLPKLKQPTTNTNDISQAQRQQASRSFIISAHNSKTNPNALQEWQSQNDSLINTHAVLELYYLAKDNAVKMANKTIVPNTAAEPTDAINNTRNTFINGVEENAIQILARQISQGKGYEIKLAELWSDKPIYIHHYIMAL